MPVVEQEPHFRVIRCTRTIRASTFRRFDQYTTLSQSCARPLSRARIAGSAVEKNGEDRFDDAVSLLLVEAEQRAIKGCAEPSLLVVVDLCVREPGQQRFGFLRQLGGRNPGLGKRLIVFQRPTDPKGTGR